MELQVFGVGAASASYYMNSQNAKKQKKASDEIREKFSELKKQNSDLQDDVKAANSELQEVKKTLNEVKAEQKAQSDTLSKLTDHTKKFVDDFNLLSIRDVFNKTVEFLSSFDLFTQSLIFNILTSSFLLSLLTAFLFGKYGNYLIDRFNIAVKYPKLNRILQARLQFQKYYFTYLTILAIATLLLNIFLNINAMLI